MAERYNFYKLHNGIKTIEFSFFVIVIDEMKRYLYLSISSGILLALAWPTYGFAILAFFGLIPLLALTEEINFSKQNKKGLRIFGYSYLGFLLWNLITTWWIVNSTLFGACFAILCNSSFFGLIFTLYRWVLTRVPKTTARLFFICLWMSFEKFHLNWDFSWPWLNLGNVFSSRIYWIQWYEFTGGFGGTLWVLVVNFIGLKWLQHYQKTKDLRQTIRGYAPGLLWIALPIAISMYLYTTIEPSSDKARVIALQPNIDPYDEKYKYTNLELLSLAQELSQKYLDNSVDYLLTPEGFFDEGSGLNLARYKSQPFSRSMQQFMEQFPTLSWISGIQSYRLYPPSKRSPTPTANAMQKGGWYDIYNSAIQFNSTIEDQLYHKSKLVVGVEYMPYKSFLVPLIGEFLLDFGGTIATRGIQKNRTVFKNNKGIKTAPIICYESIYGSFVTEYVRNGANFMSIITNDAWWGNTQGHQQLLSYASLRAIENRRAIARSANTGISAFINAKGEIKQQLNYLEQGALVGELELRNELTFYTRYGDYLARWALLLFVLILLIAVSGRLKK